MAGLSESGLANRWLDMLGGTAFTAPSGTYVQLHTGDPGDAGTANTSAETTRKQLTWAAASDASKAITSTVPSWTSWSAGSETVSHLSVWDAATDGNYLFSTALGAARSVADGDTLTLGSLTFSLTTTGGGAGTLPLFDVDAYGAVGDGTTDDYTAIKAAWDDMVAAGAGYLYFPRRAVYRIDATNRLTAGDDGQYALFPIPKVDSSTSSAKQIFGVLGVGEANVIRSWAGADTNTAANVTASVLQVDYDDDFAWDATHGHPSVFGGPDADKAATFSNVHFRVEHLVIRQEPNPSMCSLNLECVSTAHIVDLYCDVSGFLDAAPVPTNPTGCALLLPRTGNAVQVKVDNFGAWGHYAGLPITEHSDTVSAIVVRCKVGAFIRRTTSAHFAHIGSLSMEQCTWGLAGYDPSATGPNLGVTACPNWVVRIDFWDVEDFDALAGMYTPEDGAHLYDPDDVLKGSALWARVDSGADAGDFETAYVVGGTNFKLLKLSDPTVAVDTADGTAPANPDTGPPDAPTIGTATAGDTSASVTFTPAGTGTTATSFTATSTPGSITGTGTSSPITVTGLTNGTSYTFTVHASNDSGDSAESAASNSVTPAASGATVYAADTFTRADSDTTLGTSSGGQVWTALNGTWGITSNAAHVVADNSGAAGGYNIAVLDAGESLVTYTVDVTPMSGSVDLGLVALVRNVDDLVFWDLSGDTLNSPTGITTRLFLRSGGSFTGITNAATATLQPATTVTLKMVVAATAISCYIDDTLVFASTGATGLEAETKFGLITAAGTADHTSTFDNLQVTDGA